MDLQGFLKNKLGPLPMGAWIFIAVVVAFAIVKINRKKGTGGSGSADPSTAGQFSTSQTRTDKDGNTVTYSASGPNSSIQSPAQLTYGASPMGYSGGDIYVNVPVSTPAPQPTPTPTPLPPPPAPPPHHHHHNWWDDLWDLFIPAGQITSTQVPQLELDGITLGNDTSKWYDPAKGQTSPWDNKQQLTDPPGNSSDSLFNPDNVHRIFG